MYGAVALSAASREGVDMTVLHADMTSVSVQGAYKDNAQEDILFITLGVTANKRGPT